VANPEHLELLQQGVDVWNAWRVEKPSILPDLSGADLSGADLRGVDLSGANLNRVNLSRANLSGANLSGANLNRVNLSRANLSGANLSGANLSGVDLHGAYLNGANLHGAYLRAVDLSEANLSRVDLKGADLRGATFRGVRLARADLRGAVLHRPNLHGADLIGADFSGANLTGADLSKANLSEANLIRANLIGADFSGADFSGADLIGADFSGADLGGADLGGANLRGAVLVEANLAGALLTGCNIYGVSAWNVKLSETTKQQDLVITAPNEPEVTVDNIEVAQFVYLVLHNEKIRDVIDTVGKKGVLLLGRFTEGRIVVLDRLRDELRKRGYLPIVFNFDKPETKDFTETVRLLAGLSKFVIVDLSSPKSAPYELGAIVSQTMIPFQPIIEAGETPFAMLRDLLTSYPDRVFQPIEYPSVDRLIERMDAEIIEPAETRFNELVMRRAETTLMVRRL
jgi:uncharacterized protein YjbI with pentapeptide repeats